MKLDRDAVIHIAKLARVALSDDEVEMFRAQLSDIITHFDVLNAVDTDAVEPTAQALALENVFADDVARPSLPQEDVLAMAPSIDEGYLRVRAVLD